MEHQWFFADRDGGQNGPMSSGTLRDHFASRAIDMTTQVWRNGLAGWMPLASVAEELGLAAPPFPPMIPPPGAAMPPPPPPAPPASVNPYADTRARSEGDFATSLTDDSSLIRAFVGPNFERYQEQWVALDRSQGKIAWNWSAFLLGCIWMGYRKMYLQAAVIIGIIVLLTLIEEALELSTAVGNGISIGCGVAIGLLGNYLYRMHVQRKLSELPRHLSKEETITAALHMGGTSVGGGVCVGLFFVALLVFAALSTV